MRRALLIILVLLAGAGGAYWWIHLRPAATTASSAAGGNGGRRGGGDIPVVVAEAQTKDVPIWLDGLGTVQASATVTVKPMVDGPMLEVLFKEGQDVKTGDVLARIDPRTYQAAYDQAVAKKKQDEANLANARVDLARYQKLAATAYTSAQQADTQKATVAQLEAQVAQDQAAIDTARTQLSYTTVTSPVDGRAGIRQVDAGNIVHASDSTGIVVITTLHPIAVVFTLPQQNLAAAAAAMAESHAAGEAGPEVLALPQSATVQAGGSGSQPLDKGHLTVIDNQVDATTGTIKLKAEFPNQRTTLWPGAFVTVRLKVETKRNAVVVPPVAVQRGPRGAYAFVLSADKHTVARRDITVSHEDLTSSVIAAGVKPGEMVVVDGAARLSDGAKVNVLPAPGTTSPGTAPSATPNATPGATPETPVAGEAQQPQTRERRGGQRAGRQASPG